VQVEDVAVEDFGGFYAPTLITAYQVNFRVSANAQTGNLRLKVIIDGVSSQEARLPVRRP
jgi:uncharacterized protein (TIGR03437 family)